MNGVMITTIIMGIGMIAVSVWILNIAYGRKWGNEEEKPPHQD